MRSQPASLSVRESNLLMARCMTGNDSIQYWLLFYYSKTSIRLTNEWRNLWNDVDIGVISARLTKKWPGGKWPFGRGIISDNWWNESNYDDVVVLMSEGNINELLWR